MSEQRADAEDVDPPPPPRVTITADPEPPDRESLAAEDEPQFTQQDKSDTLQPSTAAPESQTDGAKTIATSPSPSSSATHMSALPKADLPTDDPLRMAQYAESAEARAGFLSRTLFLYVSITDSHRIAVTFNAQLLLFNSV